MHVITFLSQILTGSTLYYLRDRFLSYKKKKPNFNIPVWAMPHWQCDMMTRFGQEVMVSTKPNHSSKYRIRSLVDDYWIYCYEALLGLTCMLKSMMA